MTENELKQKVLKVAKMNGWLVYHVPQATMHNGGGRGYPDLTLARDGEILWIELKAETGKMSEDQATWAAALPNYHLVKPSWWDRVGELLA